MFVGDLTGIPIILYTSRAALLLIERPHTGAGTVATGR